MFLLSVRRICAYTWVSTHLMGDGPNYQLAIEDEERASSYWNVQFPTCHIRLFENEERFIYRNEDMVRAEELDSPQGAKLKRLFDHVIEVGPCYEDQDSRSILHIFYFNVTKLGNSTAIGRTYFYNNHLYIVLPISSVAGQNAFSHELGHALYYSNPDLNGNDPVTGTPHHDVEGNLMHARIASTGILDLEQEQLDAVNNSYLVNPDVSLSLTLTNNTSVDLKSNLK